MQLTFKSETPAPIKGRPDVGLGKQRTLASEVAGVKKGKWGYLHF